MKTDAERYRLLIQHLPDAFAYHQIVTDDLGTPVDYVFLEVNAAFEEMTGLKRESVINRKVTEVWPGIEEDEHDWIGTYGHVARSGEAIHQEIFAEPLGRRYQISAYSDEPGFFAVVFHDVTEEHRRREDLREERERLEYILNITGTGIDIVDADFNLRFVDRGWQEVYGDPAGRKCFEYFMGRGEPCPGCNIFRALETREVVVSEKQLPTEDNKVVEVHTIPFQDAAGQWLAVEFKVDITERKRAEKTIQESQNTLESILESTLSGYWDWNLEDNTEFLSPSFKSMFGYEDHEMENSPEAWQRIIFPEDLPGVFEVFDRHVASRGREPFYNEVRYRHKDGSTLWVICAGRVIEWSASGSPIRMVGCHVNITERKQAEKALLASEKHLAAKNKELEQMVYIASHDLRSPLVNVDGFSRELEYSLQEINGVLDADEQDLTGLARTLQAELPDMKKSLERIRTSARQMDALLKGLLQLSRSSRAVLQIAAIDMNELVGQVASSFAFRLQEDGIELSVEELPACRGDAMQLTQVFANLLDNAVKYLDPNRPGRITIMGEVQAHRCNYRIEDNGMGIADSHQERVFHLFHRLQPGHSEGEGLGLTIARQILDRMDGEIALESRVGVGSTFIVSLPTAAGDTHE